MALCPSSPSSSVSGPKCCGTWFRSRALGLECSQAGSSLEGFRSPYWKQLPCVVLGGRANGATCPLGGCQEPILCAGASRGSVPQSWQRVPSSVPEMALSAPRYLTLDRLCGGGLALRPELVTGFWPGKQHPLADM